MTDYSSSALDDMKKKIAHAAIEWELRREPVEWSGNADDGWYGASWEGRLPAVSGPTGTVDLKYYNPGLGMSSGTPPGAKAGGSGSDGVGSTYTKYTIDPWADIYQPWISRIDDAFEGWDTLPDPGAFDGLVAKVKDAVMTLTPNPSDGATNDTNGDFAQTFSNPDTNSDLSFLDKYVGPDVSTGMMVAHFRLAYGAPRIASIMTNQGQVAIALGIALLAEKKLWEGARKDVMDVADQAYDCFSNMGLGGGDIDLDVVKAFLNLAGLFVPGPIAKALEVADAGLDLAQAVMPEDTGGDTATGVGGMTPDEAYDSLVDAMSTLGKRVYDQEYEISSTTLDGMITTMRSMKPTTFHIHPASGLDQQTVADSNKEVLKGDLGGFEVVGHEVMPRIAALLAKAAQSVDGADSSGPWTRSWAIGMGASGCYDHWSALQGLFDEVTTGSGKEIVEAGQLLATAAGYQKDADGDVKKALGNLQSTIDRGEDGWDNSPPPTQVYVGGHYLPI